MDSSQGSRTLQFQFHGKAGEYFKIWIVNIALSILTLGIYSAWAKVRTRRYFYGNTALDGSRFDYLADPLAILKGRMIVFAVILVYAVSVQYIPPVEFLFILLYLVALPWMIVKSMQFNTRNTSYRNVRFNFDGSLKEAVLIFVGLSILIPFTLGLILPYVIKRYKQYMVANSMFGTTHFNFDAATKSFYWIYIKAFI
ncbi:MAG: YjgN family protein, partial [Gammaproteobacteria bacterium]